MPNFEWTITVGNLMTLFGAIAAALLLLAKHSNAMTLLERNNTYLSEGVDELKKIAHDLQKANAALDRRLAILEDRGNRPEA